MRAVIKHMLPDARCHICASQKRPLVALSVRMRTVSAARVSLGADDNSHLFLVNFYLQHILWTDRDTK